MILFYFFNILNVKKMKLLDLSETRRLFLRCIYIYEKNITIH